MERRISQHRELHRTEASPAASLATLQPPCPQISHEQLLLLIVRTGIEKNSTSLETPYFKVPSLQLLECAPAFWRMKGTGACVDVVRDIFEFAASDQARARLVSNTLPHLLRGRPLRDKRALIDVALALPSRSLRKSMAYGVLRSGTSRDELERILTDTRKAKLLGLASKSITEIVAKIEVLRALKQVSLVPAMWDMKFQHNNPENRKIARHRVRALGEAAQKGLVALSHQGDLSYPSRKSQGQAQGSRILSRPLREAISNLTVISNSVDRILQGPRQSYARLRDCVNANARRLSLECREGLRFFQSHTLPDKDLWTPKRVQKVLDALHMIPEGDRLMAPKLREFVVADLKHYGERRQSGRIALSAGSTLEARQISSYGGNKTITWVTIHEVAHSLQMGLEGAFVRWDPITGEQLSPNHPLINFGAFMALSGWRVLGTYSKKDLIDRNAVSVGGGVYPLDRPVLASMEHIAPGQMSGDEKRWVIFRFNDSFLFCHDATAQFSLDKNACKDPGEDWAETFSEYILCPDRLIQAAPEKFYYMELHFQVYRAAKDFSLIGAAYRELRALAALRAPFERSSGQQRDEGVRNNDQRQQLFDFSRRE